jgi:hypothetical protein
MEKQKKIEYIIIEAIISSVLATFFILLQLPDIAFILFTIIIVCNFFLVDNIIIRIFFLGLYGLLYIIIVIFLPIDIISIVLTLFRYSSFYTYDSINILFFINYIFTTIFAIIYIFQRKDRYIAIILIIPISLFIIDFLYFTINNIVFPSILLLVQNLLIYTFLYYLLFYINMGMIYIGYLSFNYFINQTGFNIKIRLNKKF